MQLSRVVLPSYIAFEKAGKKLRRAAALRRRDDGTTQIQLLNQDLSFYWTGEANNNLYFLIEQEYCEKNPHCYTTPPIQLARESVVLDVGACEGLFAYRLLQDGLCAKVICFEPSPDMATLIWRGAVENGLATGLVVEPVAVAASSGPVRFVPTDNPDASRIEPASSDDGGDGVLAVSLDDYCSNHQISLKPSDLIKVDAEGADFDVLRGAENLIRSGAPQIAATTYHEDRHAEQMIDWLRKCQPDYRFRLKGFSHWTVRPRPVLLQAAL